MSDILSSLKLHLVGCGKMGSALLKGWLANGLPPENIWITDPSPSEWVTDLSHQGSHLNQGINHLADILIIAVKPQMMSEILPQFAPLGNGKCLVISIAAGISITSFKQALGNQTPVIRVMPNTPTAIGAGISGIIGSQDITDTQMHLAFSLMETVGEAVKITDEEDIHTITAVSGSGPAYVFALAEALENAATAKGLPQQTARQLVISTLYGAAALMKQGQQTPEELRISVTSANGTTQAGLAILQNTDSGLGQLIDRTITAAHERSRTLVTREK